MQAHFPAGTDESPELCPQSLLPWRWFCLGLVERQRHELGATFPPPVLCGTLTCKPVAVGCAQDCTLEAEGCEEEMGVRASHWLYFKTAKILSLWELIHHFSQGISPAGCKSMGSPLEKGSHPILSPQIEVLGKVLLLTLAAASSTPTELYANSNRFPPLVPNWPHVGFFFLPVTTYCKVSGVPGVTPFAQRRIW